jgi:hypothetical protein
MPHQLGLAPHRRHKTPKRDIDHRVGSSCLLRLQLRQSRRPAACAYSPAQQRNPRRRQESLLLKRIRQGRRAETVPPFLLGFLVQQFHPIPEEAQNGLRLIPFVIQEH